MGDEEGGDGEDGTGGDAFADGAAGAGNVFFEQRTFPGAHEGHADDGGGISSGDGHTGAKAEICVGCAQDDCHGEAESEGAKSQLLHFYGFGYEWFE